jgi:hypothetical protein
MKNKSFQFLNERNNLSGKIIYMDEDDDDDEVSKIRCFSTEIEILLCHFKA